MSSDQLITSCCLYNPISSLLILQQQQKQQQHTNLSSSSSSSFVPLSASDLPPSAILQSLMSDTDNTANQTLINSIDQLLIFIFLFLSVGTAVADFPQLITVVFNRDASGLSLTAICTKIFSLSICFTKLALQTLIVFTKVNNQQLEFLSLPELSFPNSFLPFINSQQIGKTTSKYQHENDFSQILLLFTAIGAGVALLENLLLLLSITVFNPSHSKWPKFSSSMLIMTLCCAFFMIFTGGGVFVNNTDNNDNNSSHRILHRRLLELFLSAEAVNSLFYFGNIVLTSSKSMLMISGIEWLAFTCCLLSPCWSWYFNYKHKSTRRFSKASQLIHTVVCALGLFMIYIYFIAFENSAFPGKMSKKLSQVPSMSSTKKYVMGFVGVWHLVFHLIMVWQVVNSDRIEVMMMKRKMLKSSSSHQKRD